MTLKPEVLAPMLHLDNICRTGFMYDDLSAYETIRSELLAMDARLGGVDIYNPSSTLKPIAGYVVLVDGSLLKTIHPTLESARERAMRCYADKHLVSIATIGGPTKLT